MRNINKEETVATILESGNYVAANEKANMEEANLTPTKKASRMLLAGVFLCIVASEVVKEFLLLAAVGSILMLWGAVRMKEISRWIRPVVLLSAAQILWRVLLTVCSYIPALSSSEILGWVGYGFTAVGLLQLVFLQKALLDAIGNGSWQTSCEELPILEIGYIVLVVLGFFGGVVAFAAKIVIGIALAWYLYRIYQSAE